MRDGKNMTTKKIWKIWEKATRNDRSLRKQEQMVWRVWERDGKIKEWIKKISMFEWMKTSKGNMQAITSEGKNDLTKQNCKIKNG